MSQPSGRWQLRVNGFRWPPIYAEYNKEGEGPKSSLHLFYQDGELSKRVLDYCPTLLRAYRAPFWAWSPHIQDLLAYLRRFSIDPKYYRQLLPCDSGGIAALDWFRSCNASPCIPPNAPILLVLPDLTGDSDDGVCRWICSAAVERNWRAVVLNSRLRKVRVPPAQDGCAGLPLATPTVCSAGNTADLAAAVANLRARFPCAPLCAVAFSAGALLLTKYLGQAGEKCELVATSMVSSPFKLPEKKAQPERWSMKGRFNRRLVSRWQQYAQQHQEVLVPAGVDVDEIAKCTQLSEIDALLVCKANGYKSAEAYHADVDSSRYIPSIKKPTLYIISSDDPLLEDLPMELCLANPDVMLSVTKRGGHCGFISRGLRPLGKAWSDSVVMEFLEANVPPAAERAAAAAGGSSSAAPKPGFLMIPKVSSARKQD